MARTDTILVSERLSSMCVDSILLELRTWGWKAWIRVIVHEVEQGLCLQHRYDLEAGISLPSMADMVWVNGPFLRTPSLTRRYQRSFLQAYLRAIVRPTAHVETHMQSPPRLWAVTANKHHRPSRNA